MFSFASSVHFLFSIYTLMLVIRLISSWFPSFSRHPFIYYLSRYTDPYLNVFRRIIPPIGGVLDLSPLLAFFALRILEGILLYLL